MPAPSSAITSQMPFPRAARALLFGLLTAAALVGAARAEPPAAKPLGACLWSKLSAAEHGRILAAYGKDMGAGAEALDKLRGKLKAQAAVCAGRRDVPADWIQIAAGSQGVQAYAADALAASHRIDRARLDAAWAAAPASVAACVRATARVAYFPNGMGCVDPAAPAWLLGRVGLSQSQQPAARQALYYFNAKAIGEWADKLLATLAARPKS